jgi:hypothetical protein
MKAVCSEEEFIALWAQYKSATKVAKHLGIGVRHVNGRRKRIEERKAISMRYEQAPWRPEHPGRAHFEIENGCIFVGSDAHYWPGEASTAHRAFVLLAKRMRPSAIVMNGDAFDGASISRHPRIGWDNKPTVKEELQAVTERLAELEALSKNLFWPLGNHCARMETFLAANAPQFEGVQGFRLKDHFPLWKPCWALWVNDDVVIKHRVNSGIHATHTNTLKSGTTIITGHLHSLKVTPFTDYNGTRFGVDTGTMADVYGEQFVDYLEANPVSWRSGFVVLTFKDGRLLWPEVVHVLDPGHVEFRGEVIHVDETL